MPTSTYRLNGYTINEFHKLTNIPIHNLYRYLNNADGREKEAIQRAFEFKYGNDIADKYEQFYNHYLYRFLRAKPLRATNQRFWDLKQDFTDSAEAFKLRESTTDKVWDRLMNTVYYPVVEINDLTTQQRALA